MGKARVLEDALREATEISGSLDQARFYKDAVLAAMAQLRTVVDTLETHTAADVWPYPSYGDLLYSVK